MFSRIHDNIGRSLLILFLIKPIIDLSWWMSFPLAGRRLSPMHISAGLLFFYLLQFRFRPGWTAPPFLRIFETFLGLHIISMFIGMATNDKLSPIGVVDFMLRVGDSYLIYFSAFLAATRYQYRDVTPFIKAIVIGSSIVVIANAIAVRFDLDFGVYQAGISAAELLFRERGLYYDAGALANVAFSHLAFSVLLLHLSPPRSRWLYASCLLLLILLDLYLIEASHSRSFIIQLAIFGFFYLLMFQKKWGKLLAPIVTSIVLGLAVIAFDIDFDELFSRFESETAALEGNADLEVTSSGEVSFGSLEGLGSNRGAQWAASLTRILKRSAAEIMFGNFSVSTAHSDYIDIMSRSGIIGLLVYLILIVGLTLRTWRLTRGRRNSHDRTISYMAFILLICYLAYSLPFRPIAYTTTSWYMWAIIAFAMARSRLAPLEAVAVAKARSADQASRPEPVEEGPELPYPNRQHPARSESWRPSR